MKWAQRQDLRRREGQLHNSPAATPRRLTFVVTAFSLLAPLALGGCDLLQPFEEACAQRLAPTQIDVEIAPVSYVTDFGKSTAELTALGAATTGRRVLGLTQTNLNWSAAFNSNGITRRIDGRHCLRPAIKVRLAFEPMTVLISREFAPGSCIFDITMSHEMKHVQTYERFLPAVQAAVRRELDARFGQRIFQFASEPEAERQMQALTRDTSRRSWTAACRK